MNDAQPKLVVLVLSPAFDLGYTALKALNEAEKRQRQRGVLTWLVGLNPGVLEMVRRSPLGKRLGREGMQFSLELAIARYLLLPSSRLDGGGVARLGSPNVVIKEFPTSLTQHSFPCLLTAET